MSNPLSEGYFRLDEVKKLHKKKRQRKRQKKTTWYKTGGISENGGKIPGKRLKI